MISTTWQQTHPGSMRRIAPAWQDVDVDAPAPAPAPTRSPSDEPDPPPPDRRVGNRQERRRGNAAFRLLAWSFALLVLALPVVALLNGSFASERWPLRQLDLQAPLRNLDPEQVRMVVDRHTRGGFFALSLVDLRDALAELPWVRSAEVRKRWPDTVVVHLHEHQPYAVWDGDALVSRTGELFHVPGIATIGGLPRLSGPDERVADVINFHARAVRLFEATSLRLESVQLSPRGSWLVELDGGAEILLGRDQPDQRLARFAATVPTLLRQNPDTPLKRADLRYPNGYALAWAAPGDDEQATADMLPEPVAPPQARVPTHPSITHEARPPAGAAAAEDRST